MTLSHGLKPHSNEVELLKNATKFSKLKQDALNAYLPEFHSGGVLTPPETDK